MSTTPPYRGFRSAHARRSRCRALLPPPRPRDRRALRQLRPADLSRVHGAGGGGLSLPRVHGRAAPRLGAPPRGHPPADARPLAAQHGHGAAPAWSVTKALVAINVVVFLIEIATGAGSLTLTGAGSAWPCTMGSRRPYDVLALHQVLAHGHASCSCTSISSTSPSTWSALWCSGQYVEACSATSSSSCSTWSPALPARCSSLIASPALGSAVGASGAIFGIFGALIAYAFINRHRDFARAPSLVSSSFCCPEPALTFGADGISWQGHVGGLAGGTALMAGYMLLGRKNPGGRFTGSDIAFTVAALVLIVHSRSGACRPLPWRASSPGCSRRRRRAGRTL